MWPRQWRLLMSIHPQATQKFKHVFAIIALWASWWTLTRAYLTNVRGSWEPLHLGGCWISTATLRPVDECWKSWLQLGMPMNVHSKWVISSYPSPFMTLPLYWGCPWGGSQLIATSLMLEGLWWKHCYIPIWRQLRQNRLNWWHCSPNLL